MSQKEKFALYLTPEMKARLERHYMEDGSCSLTGFIENAINFYLNYLSANNAGMFLPSSVQSYLDGRLSQLERRLSAISFDCLVGLDELTGIIADNFEFTEDELRRRRRDSINTVKKTNGLISLDKRAYECAQ